MNNKITLPEIIKGFLAAALIVLFFAVTSSCDPSPAMMKPTFPIDSDAHYQQQGVDQNAAEAQARLNWREENGDIPPPLTTQGEKEALAYVEKLQQELNQ